jgi:radical SAM superfamily enzyme YgiQ (UPF0313 family)
MYTSKSFRVRPFDEVAREIEVAALAFPQTEKVFLADGDALVLSNKKLLPILSLLYEKFPRLQRVTSYALPKNLLVKSLDELKELRAAGLKMLYYGVESGDPLILQKIQKGATVEQMIEGMLKAQAAGMVISTTNLLGVGGRKYSEQHALNTAKLLSQVSPKYISFLTLMFPLGQERFLKAFGDDFEELNPLEILQELKSVVAHLEVKDTEFRSNHASNYLPLKAKLPEEKENLLEGIAQAIRLPGYYLRPEAWRGL